MERSPCSVQTVVTTTREPGDEGPERGAQEEGVKKPLPSRKRVQNRKVWVRIASGALGTSDLDCNSSLAPPTHLLCLLWLCIKGRFSAV